MIGLGLDGGVGGNVLARIASRLNFTSALSSDRNQDSTHLKVNTQHGGGGAKWVGPDVF